MDRMRGCIAFSWLPYLQKVDEVGQVLQEPLDNKTALDNADVDDELEELEKEEKLKLQAREAEETKKRLSELEHLNRARQEQTATKDTDAATLQKQTEQLKRLSIEDVPTTNVVRTIDERQQVPESAT